MFFLISSLIPSGIRKQSPFFLRFITNTIASKMDEFINPNIKKEVDYLESLAAATPDGGPWLCGSHLSGADFMMSFPLQACKHAKFINEKEHPKLIAFVDRVEATGSYKKAVHKIIEVDGTFEGLF